MSIFFLYLQNLRYVYMYLTTIIRLISKFDNRYHNTYILLTVNLGRDIIMLLRSSQFKNPLQVRLLLHTYDTQDETPPFLEN